MNELPRVIEPDLFQDDGRLARAGFRLVRLEVLNWGTFDAHVWGLELGGDNALLTGDIGSGKSTLVDAVTTLLAPHNRINYNRAAGAGLRERDLKSYVLGYYKSEKGETGLSAKPVALRDHNSYSVILGHFRNDGFDSDVTLAQVFWLKDHVGQPDRFYVVADRRLSIADDFGGFGAEIVTLKKRLKSAPRIDVHETFPPLRRRLPPPLRHRKRAGARTLSPDGVDEVGGQSHRFRAQPHAGAFRCGRPDQSPGRSFRRPHSGS